MMADSPDNTDLEDPPQSRDHATANIEGPNSSRLRIIALSVFLLVAVALSISLGVTLGNRGSSSANATSVSNVDVNATGGEPPQVPPASISPATRPATTVASSTVSSTDAPSAQATKSTQPNNLSTTTTSSTDSTVDQPPPALETESGSPSLAQSQFLRSNGPIPAKVRMASPDIANGYSSCDDLKGDIMDALKHYANSIIVNERSNTWYENCDPNKQGNGYMDFPVFMESVEMESVAMSPEPPSADAVESTPASAPASKVESKVDAEDSFGTNNQVDGVDEADVVKSDGRFVYAAYGDLLYVWNATDGSVGMSSTEMPQEAYENCTRDDPYRPFEPWDDIVVEDDNSLDGTSWEATGYYNKTSFVRPLKDSSITLEFDGRSLTGNAGCNVYQSDLLSMDEEELSFEIDSLSVKEMYCSQELDEQEQAYLKNLQGKVTYLLYGDSDMFLDLLHGDVIIASFKLVQSKVPSLVSSSSSEGDVRRHLEHHRRRLHIQKKTRSFAGGWYNPCQKPRILSLLLSGSRLTAIVSENQHRQYGYGNGDQKIIDDHSKLYVRVYDVSDPQAGTSLDLLSETEIKGSYKSARAVQSGVHIFSTSYINTWQFVDELYRSHPMYCGLNYTEYEMLAVETTMNKTEAFMEDMIGELQLQLDGTCDNIFQVAALQSGDSDEDSTGGNLLENMVMITSFDMDIDDGEEIETEVSGAFSSGYLSSVYASQDFAATLNVGSRYNNKTNSWDQATFILGFDLSSQVPVPFCYAEVPGSPLNQYSSDYYQGYLRVVTTEWQWNSSTRDSSTTNRLFVLDVPSRSGSEESGSEMQVAGMTPNLGKPNESVFSVRFIGDKAYVVTFERTDPFYIIDLQDPALPQVVGELSIPGFSSYLHPLEIDGVPLILGIGEAVSESTGRREGVKISLFDVSNSSNPIENATIVEKGAHSSAGHDYYSFRYLDASQKLIIPKSEYSWTSDNNFDGFVVYDISLSSITSNFVIQHASSYDIFSGCWYGASMPARSLVFQSKLTTILSHGVISSDLYTGVQEWNVSLDERLSKTECFPYFRF